MSSWHLGKDDFGVAGVLDSAILAHEIAVGPIDADRTPHGGGFCFDEAGTVRGRRGG